MYEEKTSIGWSNAEINEGQFLGNRQIIIKLELSCCNLL